MPATTMEHSSSTVTSVSMSFRGRSLLSLRRNQVVSMDHTNDHDLHELDLFQSHVADLLLSLLPSPSPSPDNPSTPKTLTLNDPLLSWTFLQKLLSSLLSCENDFKSLLLLPSAANVTKPPLDRAISDLLDRTVKSLDICNAISHALHSLRHWHRHADIASSALTPPNPNNANTTLGPAQLNRARKALDKLFPPTTPPDSRHHRHDSSIGNGSKSAERNRSFGLPRTLSWGVSRNWSAAKQVQAMWTSLVPPKGLEPGGGGAGFALAVYTMSSFLVFTMWALVAAFPSGAAAAASSFAPPRQLPWAAAMVALQERIVEEWKRKDKKGAVPSVGLLAELQGVERSGRGLLEAVGGGGAEVEEVAGRAEELAEACRRLEEGLGPFERQVREVFHRIVGSRAEVLRCLDQNGRAAPLSMVL